MLTFIALALCALLLETTASVLHLPLQAHHPYLETLRKRSLQQPLLYHQDLVTATSLVTLPIKEAGFYALLAPISIGTPPQNFSTVLSLFHPEIFVLSSNYTGLANRTHYNSTLSETYEPNGTVAELRFIYAHGTGPWAEDVVGVSGLVAQRQSFVEAESLWIGEEVWDTDWEGVLGLGKGENLVSELFKQGQIEEDVFTIRVPREEYGIGELVIGGSGIGEGEMGEEVLWVDATEKEMVEPDPDGKSKQWGVEVNSIYYGSDDLGIGYENGKGNTTVAWLETEVLWLALPRDMATRIHKYIGANRLGWSEFMGVDCEGRDWYPDLSFKMGKDGIVVNVTAWDYVLPIEMNDGGDEMCISLLIEYGVDAALFGVGFFRGFDISFEGEAEKIGFLKRQLDSA